MKAVRWRCALGAVVLLAAASLPSCMHERKLVQITVEPADATFGAPDPNAQIVFTALGAYIHPPDTRDITNQVTWKSDIPQLLTVDKGVVSPTGAGCGIVNISASMNQGGNLVIGFATVTIDDPTNPGCPGGSNTQAVVTVTPGGSGAGTITSAPAGINCPAQACGALFTVGDTIVLTATAANGHTFTSWTNCPSGNSGGNNCSVLVQTTNPNITATFN